MMPKTKRMTNAPSRPSVFDEGSDEAIHLDVHLDAYVPLHEDLEDGVLDDRAVQAFDAQVAVRNGREVATPIGALRGYILRVDLIWNHQGWIPEVCDNHSGTLAEYAAALFDEDTNSFSDA